MDIKRDVDTLGKRSPVNIVNRENPFWFVRLAVLAFFITTVAPCQSAAEPPVKERTYPGSKEGFVNARWIAPYVFATRYEVLGSFETIVRWYDDKGKVTQELSGPSVMAADEYISEGFGEETVIHGLSGRWKLALPKKATVLGGFFLARGETFFREFHPTMEETAMDVYESGKLVGSVGPFMYYQLVRPEMSAASDDGSVSFLIWKTGEKKGVQVVVVGPDAKIRMQVDCGEDVHQPYLIRIHRTRRRRRGLHSELKGC